MVRRILQKITIICKKCGKKFKVYNYRRNTAKYCSEKCHPFKQKKLEKEYRCDYCNKIFKRWSGHRNGKRHFCSYECKSKYQKGKQLGRPKDGIFKICPKCGKQFYVAKKQISRRINCSKSCSMKGKRPWNYIHGKGKENRKYGIYWESHRIKILERDKYTCQDCGKKGNHVDHIIPFRISQDNSFSNLQTLCISCHGKKTNWEIKYYG